MFTVGKVVVKLAGRDAGKKAVIVEKLQGQYVLIDGETRRRKCNILHLEPLKENLNIVENATHEQVVLAFKTVGVHVRESKAKTVGPKPKKVKKTKVVTPKKAPTKPKKEATQKTIESKKEKE